MSNNGGQLIVPAAMQAEIIAHARAGWPEEVCGILRGRDGIVSGLLPATNVAADRRFNYTVDPTILLRQFDFEEAGEEMIAIYHSHPVDEAYPSATDARNAFYPDAVYIICSLLQRDRPVIRAYRLLPEDLAERPVRLIAVRGNPGFLAEHHRDGLNDRYDLVVVEDDGTEHWQRVRVAELAVLVAG